MAQLELADEHNVEQLLYLRVGVLESERTSLMKYTSIWTLRAWPSSSRSATRVVLTVHALAATYKSIVSPIVGETNIGGVVRKLFSWSRAC